MNAFNAPQARWLVLSAALYFAALALPALNFDSPRLPLEGYEALAMGWFGFVELNFAWWANPLLWASWWCALRGSIASAFSLSIIALLLSCQSFFAKEWWFSSARGTEIVSLGSGFYLWLAAIAMVVVGSYHMLPDDSDSNE